MKKIILLLLMGCLSFINLTAQTFVLFGDKTFGGNQNELWGNIIDIKNGQLILEGSSFTDINGDKSDPLCPSGNHDIWILKIDTAFNILWDKDLGGGLEHHPFLIPTGINHNMLFSCRSSSDSACEKSEHNRDTLNTLLITGYA